MGQQRHRFKCQTVRVIILFALLLLPEGSLGKRLSKSEAVLARAYGYGEKQIEKMRSGHVAPLRGCSEKKSGDDFFSRFRTFEEIETFLLDRLCKLREEIGSRGETCEVKIIGHSLEDRPIYAVEIRGRRQAGRKRRALLILGTVHAREWTTTTSALLGAVRVDVTDVDVLMIPVVNPDGYVYTWSGLKQNKMRWTKGAVETIPVEARYFRKNRRLNYDGSYGVDLNRNFGSLRSVWGTDKKSKSINLTGSDIYQGVHGFSEPETKAIQMYYKQHRKQIVGFFDIHCCIPALLEPFTHKKHVLPEYVKTVGRAMLDAINTKAPKEDPYEWKPRPASSASGSGISSAWANEEAKMPFVYVLEIRGKFVMPCTEIKTIGSEVLLGLMTLLEQLSNMDELMAQSEETSSPLLKVEDDLNAQQSIGVAPIAMGLLTLIAVVLIFMLYRRKPKRKV